MTPKSVLVAVFMLVPAVCGCINFQARFVPDSNPGAFPLSAQLWDNSAQSDPPTCEMTGYKSDDGLYHLNCVASVSATFDASHFDGVVVYTRPGADTFRFSVAPAGNSGQWATCVFDCSACFVPTP